MNRFLDSIVAWLRAGYPEGLPSADTFAVLALLSRRLTNDEVALIAHHLTRGGESDTQVGEFDAIDIGVAISKLTDNMPSPEEVDRVRERLAANGWPLDAVREDEHDEFAQYFTENGERSEPDHHDEPDEHDDGPRG